MATAPDPSFDTLFRREIVEELAERDDPLGVLAREMISSADGEEAVFLRSARAYFNNHDRGSRRKAIAFLANSFGVNRAEFKRYVLFKGLVNEYD